MYYIEIIPHIANKISYVGGGWVAVKVLLNSHNRLCSQLSRVLVLKVPNVIEIVFES